MASASAIFVSILRYVSIAVLLVLVFFFLHYVGNQLLQDKALSITRDAFKSGNLIPHDKPFYVYGVRSVQSLIGQDQFTDCELLRSVLVPPSDRIQDAILPKRIAISHYNVGMCSAIHDFVSREDDEIEEISQHHWTTPLRERYWWGNKAFVSIALGGGMDIFRLNLLIKTVTYFSWLLLGIAAMWHSTRLFVLLSPMIVFGFLFSGIPYYGGFAYSLPYLVALLMMITLVVLLKRGIKTCALRIFFFVAAMIMSYVYLLDGSPMMFLPASLAIVWFGWNRNWSTINDRILHSASCLGMYAAGFTVSTFLCHLIKSAYTKSDIFTKFYQVLEFRMSTENTERESIGYIRSMVEIMERLAMDGFGIVGFQGNYDTAKLIIFTSMFASLLAVAISVYRRIVYRRAYYLGAITVIGVCIVIWIARVIMFPNHSSIHISFVGRYMFVPVALCWMMLIVSLWKGETRFTARHNAGNRHG